MPAAAASYTPPSGSNLISAGKGNNYYVYTQNGTTSIVNTAGTVLGTSTDKGNNFTPTDAGKQDTHYQALLDGNKSTIKQNAGNTNPNAATTDPNTNSSSASNPATSQASASGTRDQYGNYKYPEDLKAELQDCIKFAVMKYVPVGLESQQAGRGVVSVNNGTLKSGNTDAIGTITLPIPGNIQDTNLANWTADSLDDVSRLFSNLAQTGITGGAGPATEKAKKEEQKIDPNDVKKLTTAVFTQAATGSSNMLARQNGQVVNPNMELLFTGPQLRQFSFSFRMSPRSETEAKQIRGIIRTFKQAMSVQRSSSTLLLKAPNTFLISYISKNNQHPYLNKFKECALTNCSVNYAPEGTYMSYNGTENSMVVYDLNLSFQEIEPIFNDDYGNTEYGGDDNKDTNIGY